MLTTAEAEQCASLYGFDLRKCSSGSSTQTRWCQVSDYSEVTAAAAATYQIPAAENKEDGSLGVCFFYYQVYYQVWGSFCLCVYKLDTPKTNRQKTKQTLLQRVGTVDFRKGLLEHLIQTDNILLMGWGQFSRPMNRKTQCPQASTFGIYNIVCLSKAELRIFFQVQFVSEVRSTNNTHPLSAVGYNHSCARQKNKKTWSSTSELKTKQHCKMKKFNPNTNVTHQKKHKHPAYIGVHLKKISSHWFNVL